MSTTYAGRNVAKQVGDFFIAGSGDAASAVSAEAKAQALDDILQYYYQKRGLEFDGTDIGLTETMKAIVYARGKKHTKAVRKGTLSAAKFGLQVAAVAGGATVGSVVPVAGTALGAAGGVVAGLSLGVGVSFLDRMKRSAKGIYKFATKTRGVHRTQAAACLLHTHTPQFNRANGGNAADDALHVILGEEYEAVTAGNNTERLADRLKSN